MACGKHQYLAVLHGRVGDWQSHGRPPATHNRGAWLAAILFAAPVALPVALPAALTKAQAIDPGKVNPTPKASAPKASAPKASAGTERPNQGKPERADQDTQQGIQQDGQRNALPSPNTASPNTASPNTASPNTAQIPRPAAAPTAPAKLWFEPRKGIHTGDLITVHIHVPAQDGDDINIPKQRFDGFKLHDTSMVIEPGKNKGQLFRFKLELVALEPGQHALGPLQLRRVSQSGQLSEFETRALQVQVNSLLANEPQAKAKPASDPVTVVQPDYMALWVGGGLLAALLLVSLTWWLARRWRQRQRNDTPSAPPEPASVTARRNLRYLRRQLPEAVAKQQLGEWVDRVSDALRNYLGARYGFEGLESTSDEVLQHLRHPRAWRSVRRSGVIDDVADGLRECDLVKFAKVEPDPAQCERLVDTALSVVERSEATETSSEQLFPGEPVSGEPVSGEPVSGEPVSGEPVSGEPVSGEPVSGALPPTEPSAGVTEKTSGAASAELSPSSESSAAEKQPSVGKLQQQQPPSVPTGES